MIEKSTIEKSKIECGMKTHRLAFSLASLEGLALIGLSVYLVVSAIFRATTEMDALIAMIAFSFFAGTGLLVSAKGIKDKRHFGRAPIVLANAIAIGVSYYMTTGTRAMIGIPLGIFAAVTLIAALFAIPEAQ